MYGKWKGFTEIILDFKYLLLYDEIIYMIIMQAARILPIIILPLGFIGANNESDII
jgi:hypothetical protein